MARDTNKTALLIDWVNDGDFDLKVLCFEMIRYLDNDDIAEILTEMDAKDRSYVD